ncbi:MAG: hypothetical protein H0T62_04145 [Parachlamydiaceae bacterium]|nr:hypothetical protein [Parachlamydiaceae bacterium]
MEPAPIAAPLVGILNLPPAGLATFEQRLAILESNLKNLPGIVQTALERAKAAEEKYEKIEHLYSLSCGLGAGSATLLITHLLGITFLPPVALSAGVGIVTKLIVDKNHSGNKRKELDFVNANNNEQSNRKKLKKESQNDWSGSARYDNSWDGYCP